MPNGWRNTLRHSKPQASAAKLKQDSELTGQQTAAALPWHLASPSRISSTEDTGPLSLERNVKHPYLDRPAHTFWKAAVAELPLGEFDPVVSPAFQIRKTDRVATAGSCFAQHISKAIADEGLRFVQVERASEDDAGVLPIYSARYGNIYTCRQLRQLFERSYNLFKPYDVAWLREDGRYIDPFRPNEFPAGFETVGDVKAASKSHLAAVREVFETCDVFIFTMGLTEVWLSQDDGAAFPLAPGVVAMPIEPHRKYVPINLSVQALSDDLLRFIDDLRSVNPKARLIITVSPVPLVATFQDQHVIVSNSYSKAAQRVVAHMAEHDRDGVLYFPSYEIISAHPKARYFEDNCRAIRPEGVTAVMNIFRNRLIETSTTKMERSSDSDLDDKDLKTTSKRKSSEYEFKTLVCDEEMLAQTKEGL